MKTTLRIAAVVLCLGVGPDVVSHEAVAADSTALAPCSFAAGRDFSDNTVTCNFGLTPEQLKEVTDAAVRDATEPLLDRVVDISKKLGVTEDAAKTLLRIVGEQPDVPDERLAEVLTKVANDYKRLQVQAAVLSPDNPTARELVNQAKAEIAAGRLAHAHEQLRQATQVQIAAAQETGKLREHAQAVEDAQMSGAARSTATDGEVALTERRYVQAADLFGEAAGYVPSGQTDERLRYLDRQADALWQQGDERGDNPALLSSTEISRRTLKERPRDSVPLQWAMTQMNLGTALEKLGELEGGTARLREAVAAYRAALEENTRARVPLEWAGTQTNLGNALEKLGELEGGTARLQEAVAAYRAALEEWTRDREPFLWAMTQSNLGAALEALGEREGGTALLKEAVAAYRTALEERTRDRVPLQWARTQMNLGIALGRLGERESGTVRLEEAVAAYTTALQERTRDRVPLQWAMTQMNLGGALERLGERESGTMRLEEAVAAYRAALQENTRDRVPLQWAYSQHGLGTTLAILAMRLKDPARLKEALVCMRGAVETYEQVGESHWRSIAEKAVTAIEAQLAELTP